MATKQQITEAIRAFVERAEKVASGLSPADWQKSAYEGGWTVKQAYCHLAAMSGAAPFLINMASSPRPPGGAGGGGFDVDAWNAREVAARQDKPIEDILGEIKSGYASSIKAVEATSDELLAKEMTMPWASGTLAELLMMSVTDHNASHLDDIERAVRGG